jgi:ribosome-binding protein aMBF1 (putative translation factor)
MIMQTREDILQNLESVTATESSKWKERAARKADNPKVLEKSRIIAINILAQLRKLGLSQKDLAEKLQVTPQTVNSWVKGE